MGLQRGHTEIRPSLILGTDSGGDLLWTSPSHAVIVTRDGRIIRTLGRVMIWRHDRT